MKKFLDVLFYLLISAVAVMFFMDGNVLLLTILSSVAALVAVALMQMSQKQTFVVKLLCAVVLTIFPVFIFKVEVFASIYFFSIVAYILSLFVEVNMRRPFCD